jgi:hypothetical protein
MKTYTNYLTAIENRDACVYPSVEWLTADRVAKTAEQEFFNDLAGLIPEDVVFALRSCAEQRKLTAITLARDKSNTLRQAARHLGEIDAHEQWEIFFSKIDDIAFERTSAVRIDPVS